MEIDYRSSGAVLVATLHGRALDMYSAPDVKASLSEKIETGSVRVVVDLSEVSFLDSSGLGVLIRLLRSLPEDGRLALAACQPGVLRLLKQARVDRILETHPTTDAAVAALAVEPGARS